MIDLLKEYDDQYKIGRAKLIRDNYTKIVSIKIHPIVNDAILLPMGFPVIKEITKFDYRTNVDINGDQHIWLYYFDTTNEHQKIHVVKNIKNNQLLVNSDNYIEFNNKTIQLQDAKLDYKLLDTMVDVLLSIFRRGYDRPD